jgi:hypothetical protein
MGHIDPRLAPARFLILGSASGGLLRQTSESLAGRMERVIIGGFSPTELGAEAEQRLWLRGGFPLSYWRKAMLIVLHGAGTSFKLFLNVTSLSGVYAFRQQP